MTVNILMVLSQIEVTGAEVYAAAVADRLIQKGHAVFILSDNFTVKTEAQFFPTPFTKRKIWNRFKNIQTTRRFIKKNKIDIIHAHSRASGWVAYFARKGLSVPLITTMHGLPPQKKRLFTVLGDYTVAVCENIRKGIISTFNYPEKQIEVLRNGIEIPPDIRKTHDTGAYNVISVIGRLTGPKANVFHEMFSKLCDKFPNVKFQMIGGHEIPERFRQFTDTVEFVGYTDRVFDYMEKSTLVVGAGRVAVEALMRGIPVAAVGEAETVGAVTQDTLAKALESNFGDVNPEGQFDWEFFENEIRNMLTRPVADRAVVEKVSELFSLDRITDRIEKLYVELTKK